MGNITTHVLDTSAGRPAAGLHVTLELRAEAGNWREVGRGDTDADGRLRGLTDGRIEAGLYRLTFHTGGYFGALAVETFYPAVVVLFRVADSAQHYHVPLLVSPFGYSTYRGS